MSGRRRLGGNLLLIAGGIVAALLLLEATLRVYDPFDFRLAGDAVVLPINARYTIRTGDDTGKLDPVVEHSKNTLGFRGPNPPADLTQSPESHLSVLTVGGSTTECFYVGNGETWTDVLARDIAADPVLAAASPWVNNAGLDGHSTFGHLVLLKQALLSLSPDVAYFLTGINDVGRTDLTEYDASFSPGSRGDEGVHGMLLRLARRSRLASTLLNLARAWRSRELGLAHAVTDFASVPRTQCVQTAPEALRAEHAEALAGYRSRLEAIVRLCREHGVIPVLMTQPALYGPGKDPATGLDLAGADVRGVCGLTRWRTLELYNTETREVSLRLDAPLVDLAELLPKDSRLFYDFIHFSNAGCAAVGGIVYRESAPVLHRAVRE